MRPSIKQTINVAGRSSNQLPAQTCTIPDCPGAPEEVEADRVREGVRVRDGVRDREGLVLATGITWRSAQEGAYLIIKP
jgi:hypothetical protein